MTSKFCTKPYHSRAKIVDGCLVNHSPIFSVGIDYDSNGQLFAFASVLTRTKIEKVALDDIERAARIAADMANELIAEVLQNQQLVEVLSVPANPLYGNDFLIPSQFVKFEVKSSILLGDGWPTEYMNDDLSSICSHIRTVVYDDLDVWDEWTKITPVSPCDEQLAYILNNSLTSYSSSQPGKWFYAKFMKFPNNFPVELDNDGEQVVSADYISQFKDRYILRYLSV
jgi:hypothetical protein